MIKKGGDVALNSLVEISLYICASIFIFPFLRRFVVDVLNKFDDAFMSDSLSKEEEEEIAEGIWKWIKNRMLK